MDVVVWLRSLGLGKYEAIFREKTHENLMPTGAPLVHAAGTSRSPCRVLT